MYTIFSPVDLARNGNYSAFIPM